MRRTRSAPPTVLRTSWQVAHIRPESSPDHMAKGSRSACQHGSFSLPLDPNLMHKSLGRYQTDNWGPCMAAGRGQTKGGKAPPRAQAQTKSQVLSKRVQFFFLSGLPRMPGCFACIAKSPRRSAGRRTTPSLLPRNLLTHFRDRHRQKGGKKRSFLNFLIPFSSLGVPRSPIPPIRPVTIDVDPWDFTSRRRRPPP